MGKYLDIAKRFEARGRATLARAPTPPAAPVSPVPEPAPFHDDAREPNPDTWPCPHCGQPATIDDVCLSLDGERTLTLWRCDPCQVVAVTPDAIRQPPPGWRKRADEG